MLQVNLGAGLYLFVAPRARESNRKQVALRALAVMCMGLSTGVTDFMASKWIAQLGRTPDCLDQQSQEALYEVDVSEMALHRSYDQQQSKQPSGTSKKGAASGRWVTEPDASHDTG